MVKLVHPWGLSISGLLPQLAFLSIAATAAVTTPLLTTFASFIFWQGWHGGMGIIVAILLLYGFLLLVYLIQIIQKLLRKDLC